MPDAGRTEVRGVARRRQWIVAAGVTLFVGLWVLMVVVGSSGFGTENLDEESRAVVGAACRTALDELAALPEVEVTDPPEVRSARVRGEHEVFDRMVAAAAHAEPDESDAARALSEWLADWPVLIEAREEFATSLVGPEPRRLVVPSEPDSSRPLTVRMNEWARARGLEHCTPDALEAEVVDGPRTYPARAGGDDG